MSILIYTYSDPYNLNLEPYWDDIKSYPYFCASQTLVNGLNAIYKKENFNHARTIADLINTVFEQWESTSTMVKQHTTIDNIISAGLPAILNQSMQENIKQAFLFNRDEVFKSIRIMFELNINTNEILLEKLTPEQLFIVEIYKAICTSDKKSDFELNMNFDEKYIDQSIKTVIESKDKAVDIDSINMNYIVIHGVHQFSPIMLRLIEKLAEYKTVILLFNYQSQYKNIYQTWIDIYSAFDCPITSYANQEFKPNIMLSNSYKCNILADNIGKLLEGNKTDISLKDQIDIVEYDNLTEFANYVADIYNVAKESNSDNPLHNMREQIYSADISVNEILKTYFPEQFGERQFLNYPLGHFFLALANMWDSVNNELIINDLNDIKECLGAGILQEKKPGELLSIFNQTIALFDDCHSIDDMTARIKRLKKHKRHLTDSEVKEYVSHISYYTVSSDDMDMLLEAFNDLDELSAYFYEDFNNKAHNFKDFYKKLKNYLKTEVLDNSSLSEEFSDIVKRVLTRLKEVDNIDASASFECLKSTMSIYLTQETKPGKSANWIVRGFEQIDGDILRSNNHTACSVVYHFACLSDEDISSSKKNEFSWPLDNEFFEIAQEPVDWKYQVFVKSRKEYKNFKRYALLYGLEFNRAKFKLSYVKRDGDKEREPYYLLKLLGVKKKIYNSSKVDTTTSQSGDINVLENSVGEFSQFDYYRYKICKYRFLLESIVENTTIYKDNFLLLKYFEVLLENQAREELQGFPLSEVILIQKLEDCYDELKKYFPFTRNINRLDIIGNIKSRLLNSKAKTFSVLTKEDRQYMMIRELFIHKQLYDNKKFKTNVLSDKFVEISEDKLKEVFSEENFSKLIYDKEANIWCQYCANREICMAYYEKLDS